MPTAQNDGESDPEVFKNQCLPYSAAPYVHYQTEYVSTRSCILLEDRLFSRTTTFPRINAIFDVQLRIEDTALGKTIQQIPEFIDLNANCSE